jgi:ion channel-forming bestrophin family protein
MRGYIEYLDTFAKTAGVGVNTTPKKTGKIKEAGDILGLSFCRDNPRATIKGAKKEVGNLPMEILVYLQAYLDSAIDAGMLKAPIYQVQSSTYM